MNNNGFWQRLRFKYRISALNENTLNEVWHFRLSRMGLFWVLALLLLLTFGLMAVLIWLTPLKNYLPGYNGNIRQELLDDMARVDSLAVQADLQKQYLGIVRNVVSGEVQSDSVKSLDSLAVLQREQLLEARSAVTEEFMAQYEEKEKDNLTLFEAPISTPVFTLYRPVRGVVQRSFAPDNGIYGISILTPHKENICSVLGGTVVYAGRSLAGDWTLMVQHEGGYISLYRTMQRPLRKAGDKVQAGETLAMVEDGKPLWFELWSKGNPLNPEDVIGF
ncbi:MAG: M23 family metallopeptidase [Paludibacteraceae bacterium]|nr:M23 family metallopeptidase [Paludibacteraceae bacterium]